jgi:hypothetical protein
VINLERMLTDKGLFGLVTASPVQRAICRIIDGRPLGLLAHDPDVINAVGGPDAIAALPVDGRPTEVDLYSGVRVGKSLMAAALACRAALSVDVSGLRSGEVARVSIVSLRTDLAKVVYQHLVGSVLASPHLRTLLVGEPREGDGEIVLRHPSGAAVEIKVVAGARAGSSLVARWSAGVIFDEKPRMLGAGDDAVVNYDDAAGAIEGRLLPGAQIIGIGSPWAPWGPAFEDMQKDFGKPTRHKVVIRAPAYVLNSTWWTDKRCAELREKNPRAYRTDVLAEFAESAAGVFSQEDVDALLARPPGRLVRMGAPIVVQDAAGAGRDAWSVAVAGYCQREVTDADLFVLDPAKSDGLGYGFKLDAGGNRIRRTDFVPPAPMLVIDHFFEWTSALRRGGSSAETIYAEIAALAHSVGARLLVGDQLDSFGAASFAARHGLKFQSLPYTATNKAEAVTRIRDLAASGRLHLGTSDDFRPRLRRQLLSFVEKPTASGGVTYSGSAGYGHLDSVSVIITAALADAENLIESSPTRLHAGGISVIGADGFSSTY